MNIGRIERSLGVPKLKPLKYGDHVLVPLALSNVGEAGGCR